MSLILDELTWDERWLRTYFRAVEVLLDQALLQYSLVQSLENYREKGEPYPFVNRSELRPGGVGPLEEHPLHNTCLVIFNERSIPEEFKTNIRIRKSNRLVAANLSKYLVELPDAFDRVTAMREIDDASVLTALKVLMELDFAVVIQRRPMKKKGLFYDISHFHVKIDEVLDRVVERFGVELRYLSKGLFELGEEYAESLETKFYEAYGMKPTASGRRTAGIIAHRVLSEQPGLSIVYVASQEARSLFKWTWRGPKRFILLPFTKDEVSSLCEDTGVSRKILDEYYLYPGLTKDCAGVALFQVSYEPTAVRLPPKDRKLRREINPAERWITVAQEFILPKPGQAQARPIRYKWIYRAGEVDLVEPIVDSKASAGKSSFTPLPTQKEKPSEKGSSSKSSDKGSSSKSPDKGTSSKSADKGTAGKSSAGGIVGKSGGGASPV